MEGSKVYRFQKPLQTAIIKETFLRLGLYLHEVFLKFKIPTANLSQSYNSFSLHESLRFHR